MNTEYYIFDADGVLIDSFSKACRAFNSIVEQHFPCLPKIKNQNDMAFVYPGPLKTSFRRFGMDDKDIRLFFDLHSQQMSDGEDDLMPFDIVIQAISESVAGRCAIVTSSYSETVRTVLSKSSFYNKDMFIDILGREHRQTKTKNILNFLHNVGTDVSKSIYIGDMVSDILDCKSVPIRIAVVGYGYQPSSYLAAFDPNHILPSQQALVSFLTQGIL